jgi:V/A-type H+/Na+-transporting ATPase subunit C
VQSSYAASFGTMKVLSLNFLPKEKIYELAKARNTAEIAQELESTWYGKDIEAAASVYKPPELIEVAINRHLVDTNRIAVQASPVFARNAVLAYLSKWDIENIELIIAAKSLGKGLEQTEAFLVSSRNVPVSLSSSVISLSDLHALMQQPDVESVINSLVKYGYGAILLQQLGEFRKTGDLGVFTGALQNYYYQKLFWELRFLQGSEGVLREYIKSEITKKNILNLLKAKESNLQRDVFVKHIVSGGFIDDATLLDIYSTPDFAETVKKFEPWFDLSQSLERYRQSGNLTDFEVTMDKIMVAKYLPRFRSMGISLSAVFTFILRAEIERLNIRRITYAKQYGMTEEYIKSVILEESP